ncbi:hypothetical protein [Oryza sativa Japonica Group]|uniref:Uncharacterized protein n=1 Tax=Oryza sativa subsp. japonica TaxID=39947 RepID=Q9ASP2_ORYSJ|nr:hypothetical protein [Oryza sativa Japonica Group]
MEEAGPSPVASDLLLQLPAQIEMVYIPGEFHDLAVVYIPGEFHDLAEQLQDIQTPP